MCNISIFSYWSRWGGIRRDGVVAGVQRLRKDKRRALRSNGGRLRGAGGRGTRGSKGGARGGFEEARERFEGGNHEGQRDEPALLPSHQSCLTRPSWWEGRERKRRFSATHSTACHTYLL